MPPVRLILLGGFLGAGKTTLISRAARMLTARGLRVGLISNDQSDDLVDTEQFRRSGFAVEEVAGGCFCCHFNDLTEAAERLLSAERPDVLIGEPVGSCTDISATVLQPLKERFRERFALAPFTALADPVRVVDYLNSDEQAEDDDVMYIYGKQLEEADRILINKADLLAESGLAELLEMVRERFPDRPVEAVSARSGAGVEAWLEAMLRDGSAGRRVTAVDYDRYAEGEAKLAWLNAAAELVCDAPRDWRGVVESLVEELRRGLESERARLAHLKLMLSSGDKILRAHLTRNEEGLRVEGEPAVTESAQLLLNVRAQLAPERLQSLFERTLREMAGIRVASLRRKCFAPDRPKPTHRYEHPV